MAYQPRFQAIALELSKKFKFSNPTFAGKGAYKETFKVVNKNGKNNALKIFDPRKCNTERTDREIEAMKKCQHESIGKLIGYGSIALRNYPKVIFSVEDFFEGGTLTDKIRNKQLDCQMVKDLAVRITKAINHLKERNLVHRDIKPENIMFDKKGNPILVDFGLVRNLSRSSLTMDWVPRGPGTPLYSSPEQLNNDKFLIDWRSDQFSLGIVLSYCTYRFHPYMEPNGNEAQAVFDVSMRKDPSNGFLDFIKTENYMPLGKMISPWPIKRYYYPENLVEDLNKMGG